MANQCGKKGTLGRPTKLTPALQEKFVQAVREGQFFETACGLCGITYTAFREWMIRGANEPEGIYHEFMLAVQEAEADSEAEANKKWQKFFAEDYRAVRDWMDRRYGNRWSRKDRMEISGPEGGPIQTQDLSKLSEEELASLAALLKKSESGVDAKDQE
jgi:hypothetical protein